MSQTKQQFALTPREEAILYFIGLILIYIAGYRPPIGSPAQVMVVFGFLGTVVIFIKYELQSLAPPHIPVKYQALYAFIALLLEYVAGYISSMYGTYWYVGLIVAVIGAILAAYKDIKGTLPP